LAARKWTEQQKKNQSLAIRRWKPWLKSTGAKTDMGKATISQNAIKDGQSIKNRQIIKELNRLLRIQRNTINLYK
jgi:hypothetical protein